jgi:radical SAM superfamily enzyme YgiQ (UPF0313 family)
MKISLIHPPYSFNLEIMNKKLIKFYYSQGLVTPPLGICYIAAVLQESGHEVQILDANAANMSDDEILSQLSDYNPDLIGLSILSHAYKSSILLIQKIKKVIINAKIVVGGYHIQLYPEKTLKNEEIDFGVIGEAEITIKTLVEAIEKKLPLNTVRGIVYRKDSKIIITKKQQTIEDLDTIPFPARNLLDQEIYNTFFSSKKTLITSIITSRGCVFNCTYCSEKMYKYRQRSVKNIIAEIKECVEKYGIHEISFMDSTFTINKKHTLELCEQISKNFDIIFNIRTRVDCIDENLLIALKNAGCNRINYGVESGNAEILDMLNKGISIERIKEIVQLTKNVGIDVWAFFMLGNPGDTKQTVKQTVDLALELEPDFIQINRCSPLPGTMLHHLCNEEKGCDIWDDYFDFETEDKDFQMVNTALTPKEVDKLVRKAYRRFYYRPKYIFKRLKEIKSFSDLWLYIKAAFSIL